MSDGSALTAVFARLRVPLGFACAIGVFWLAEPTGFSIAVGGAVALVGELLRIWAAGHLNKSRTITSSGPYRWVGHPLYIGSSIMGAGLAIASASLAVVVVVVVYLGVTLTAAVMSEEAFLHRAFGDRYARYREAGVRGGADDVEEAVRFSWSRAFANREHRAIAGLALAVLLLVLKATYNGPFWRSAGARFVRPGG